MSMSEDRGSRGEQEGAAGARAVHAVRNAGSRYAAELATYVIEKGKPVIAGRLIQPLRYGNLGLAPAQQQR